MKIGWQIPWNVILICETFKISCLMGKLHTKGVLENLSKDQSFRLVHWLSITHLLRKTSQDSIKLVRQFKLEISSMHCSVVNLERRYRVFRLIRSVGFRKGPIQRNTVSPDKSSCFYRKSVFAHLEQHLKPIIESCLIANFLPATNGPRRVITCSRGSREVPTGSYSFED